MFTPSKSPFLVLAGIVFIATSAVAQTSVEEFKSLDWDKSHLGTPLDLSQYHETFRDDFDKMDITADGGKGPWYAPIHTDFGAAHFLPPGSNGPYIVKDGKLIVRADKNGDKWTGGNIQTVDGKGQGFAQQYGYFEMSAQMPPGKGTWGGFWLLSQNGFLDPSKNRTEIDVVEWYGGDPKGDHVSAHLWPAAHPDPSAVRLEKHVCRSRYYNMKSVLENGELTGFHTYGVEVTPEWVIGYFDRKEVGRFKTLPEYNTPLYMLVTMTIFPKEAAEAVGPKDLIVDYITAYSKK